jgi:hypothetical protein
MAKFSAKGCQVLIDNAAGAAQDLSTDCVSYEIQTDAGVIDVTGFSDGSKNFIPGLAVHGITFDFLYDTSTTSGATTVLRGIINSVSSKTVSVKPESAGQAFSGEFCLDNFSVKGTPDAAIQIGTVHFSVMGAVAPAWA